MSVNKKLFSAFCPSFYQRNLIFKETLGNTEKIATQVDNPKQAVDTPSLKEISSNLAQYAHKIAKQAVDIAYQKDSPEYQEALSSESQNLQNFFDNQLNSFIQGSFQEYADIVSDGLQSQQNVSPPFLENNQKDIIFSTASEGSQADINQNEYTESQSEELTEPETLKGLFKTIMFDIKGSVVSELFAYILECLKNIKFLGIDMMTKDFIDETSFEENTPIFLDYLKFKGVEFNEESEKGEKDLTKRTYERFKAWRATKKYSNEESDSQKTTAQFKEFLKEKFSKLKAGKYDYLDVLKGVPISDDEEIELQELQNEAKDRTKDIVASASLEDIMIFNSCEAQELPTRFGEKLSILGKIFKLMPEKLKEGFVKELREITKGLVAVKFGIDQKQVVSITSDKIQLKGFGSKEDQEGLILKTDEGWQLKIGKEAHKIENTDNVEEKVKSLVNLDKIRSKGVEAVREQLVKLPFELLMLSHVQNKFSQSATDSLKNDVLKSFDITEDDKCDQEIETLLKGLSVPTETKEAIANKLHLYASDQNEFNQVKKITESEIYLQNVGLENESIVVKRVGGAWEIHREAGKKKVSGGKEDKELVAGVKEANEINFIDIMFYNSKSKKPDNPDIAQLKEDMKKGLAKKFDVEEDQITLDIHNFFNADLSKVGVPRVIIDINTKSIKKIILKTVNGSSINFCEIEKIDYEGKVHKVKGYYKTMQVREMIENIDKTDLDKKPKVYTI